MSFFDWFRKKDDGPVWTVELADVKPLGMDGGLHGYQVTFRKGRQEIVTTYRFPTPKTPERVLIAAKKDL